MIPPKKGNPEAIGELRSAARDSRETSIGRGEVTLDRSTIGSYAFPRWRQLMRDAFPSSKIDKDAMVDNRAIGKRSALMAALYASRNISRLIEADGARHARFQ
jgi:hypothetical protein